MEIQTNVNIEPEETEERKILMIHAMQKILNFKVLSMSTVYIYNNVAFHGRQYASLKGSNLFRFSSSFVKDQHRSYVT